ncbi:MAG: hypothetical protein LC789_10835 [Actinobacteria bacterium]|nr:hypothetical protein [Actinomycetota bacterium]MCA1720916.1 hypothetical protein [Actinomycetota bacterium]
MSRPRSLLRLRELWWFRQMEKLEHRLAEATKAAEAATEEHGANSATAEFAELRLA